GHRQVADGELGGDALFGAAPRLLVQHGERGDACDGDEDDGEFSGHVSPSSSMMVCSASGTPGAEGKRGRPGGSSMMRRTWVGRGPRMMTRSPSWTASSMSWVTNTTVRGRAARVADSSRRIRARV